MELVMALAITSSLSVVLGALMLAVQTAREHVEGEEEATAQATACIHRISYLMAQSGIYQTTGQPTVLGVAVVEQSWTTAFKLPDTLVLWCGGRDGGMADQGTSSRLPQVNELVIYSPHPERPWELHEIVIPGDHSSIDFRDSNFNSRILSLISSSQAETVMLCDRLRYTNLGAVYGGAEFFAANLRFTLTQTPDDSQLQSITSGTTRWTNLGWSQGISTNSSGMRQATLNMEFLIDRNGNAEPGDTIKPVSIPFFGSAGYRYTWQAP